MDITIIIPVGRDSEHLPKLLNDLSSGSFARRILLSCHKPEVEKWIIVILNRLAPHKTWIELVQGVGGSAPELRNAAVNLVDSEWVLFLDDDVLLSDGYLEELRNLLVAPPSSVIQGAATHSINRQSWLSRCEERLSDARLQRWRDGDFVKVCDARTLLMLAKIAKQFPFDERLRRGSEGHELAIRLTEGGHKIYLAHRLAVRHRHRTTVSSLARQKFGHGRGRVQFARSRRLPIAFSEHLFGPFRYWRQERISLDLLPYAVLCATVFCSGMIFEMIVRQNETYGSSLYANTRP